MALEYTQSGLSDRVTEFLSRFRGKDRSYSYVHEIDMMMARGARHIAVDYNDLVEVPEIESVFSDSPDSVLEAFSSSISRILEVRFPRYAEKIRDQTRVRVVNYPVQRSLRQINAEVIGKMTSVMGMVVRASEVKSLAREVVFKCPDGHVTQIILQKGMNIAPPPKCSNPKCAHRSLEAKHESSKFIDFQMLRLQELPEDLPPGQLPHYVDVTIKQDLVDNARPGDRIILTGIVRIEQEPISGVTKAHSGVYIHRIDGNNIEFLGGRGTGQRKSERESISPDEEKKIRSLSRSPDIYERLVNSFAPHIQGHDLIKEAILLLIVGSTQRTMPDGSKIRGDINVFLVGDPGTAKSEMLKFCARVAPRGMYTSGRGSTAAGLTAAVVRDKTGIMMLEAGAVVLGDQGLVCIDEFDKMKPEDRSALHEVMEQQSASIAKGGIVATLNARTSILAAANPMYGKYDPFRNIGENVDLPIPLLTRFDLIFIIRDQPSRERDQKIARHIISMHAEPGSAGRSVVDIDSLTKYLAYVRRHEPEMTPDAEQRILDYYLKMRNIEDEHMITVTPRQLEGIIRLATARARLLLKEKVDDEDAERAIFLIEQMLGTVGVDAATDRRDLGVLYGKPQSDTSRMSMFMDILKKLEGERPTPVHEDKLVKEMVQSSKFKDAEDAKQFIKRMANGASIYESKPGHYSRVT